MVWLESRPLDHMEDILRVFEQRLAACGDPLVERGDDVHFVVRVASAAAAAVSGSARECTVDNPAAAVHELRIAPNSTVELAGTFKLQRFAPSLHCACVVCVC